MVVRGTQRELLEQVQSLRELAGGWDGDGAPAPAVGVPTATTFARALGRLDRLPSVGPANDGGVVFEWDLPNRVSVYCYARAREVEIAAFNDTKDLVELVAPAAQAAEVVRALLAVFDSRPVGAAR